MSSERRFSGHSLAAGSVYQGDRKQRKPSWRGQRGGTLPRRYCQFLTIRNASSRVS